MTDEPPSEVLGSLPRTRPHRRSQKRPPRPVDAGVDDGRAAEDEPVDSAQAALDAAAAPASPRRAKAKTARSAPAPREPANLRGAQPKAVEPKRARLRQPAQPAGTPPGPRSRRPAPSNGSDLLGTAVQAAAELAEIGLSAGARAIRSAVARLPRP
jgi:hypothetical protein